MKPYILLLAALGISAHAQITNPGSAGDYERARLLFDAGNYRAALAQLMIALCLRRISSLRLAC